MWLVDFKLDFLNDIEKEGLKGSIFGKRYRKSNLNDYMQIRGKVSILKLTRTRKG